MKIKNKIKLDSYAINLGCALENSKDIQLVENGDENLRKANSWIRSISHGFNHIVDFDNQSVFFYKIEQFSSGQNSSRIVEVAEKGVGLLKKIGDTAYLERKKSIYRSFDDADFTKQPSDTPIAFNPDKILIITTYIPDSTMDFYVFEDVVMCSSDEFTPSPVYMEENSVLGKEEDNIKPLSGIALANIMGEEGLTSLLNSTKLPLLTQSNRFELKGQDSVVISNSIMLKSTRSRPRDPLPGQIIFNSRKKRFEGYDGKSWKTLKWE